MRPLAAALAALAMQSGIPALAGCQWDWLCNGEGACRQMPVCDSVYETPPPKPASSPPAPPLAIRPARAAGSGGNGLVCEHVMRQGKSGRWTWGEACFCVDKARNVDASSPFAHIVRCDDPQPRAAAPPGR